MTNRRETRVNLLTHNSEGWENGKRVVIFGRMFDKGVIAAATAWLHRREEQTDD